MRRRTNVIATAFVPLALFAVTACNGPGSSGSEPQGDSSSASSSQNSGDSGKGQDGGTAEDGGAGTEGGSAKGTTTSGADTGGNGGGGAGNASLEVCSENNSKMTIGEEESSGVNYALNLKNESSAPCTIAPVPTVTAINGGSGDVGETLNDSQKDKKVGADVTTLKPNYTATAYVKYDSSKCQGDGDTGATTISVTTTKNSLFTLKTPGGRSAFICGGPLIVNNWVLPRYQ